MGDRPRTLRAMLAEAKDTSELMVDLAYAAVYFGDPDMAEEVDELEEQMSELVHDMRAVCVLAARSPREAEGMSSVLQVVSAQPLFNLQRCWTVMLLVLPAEKRNAILLSPWVVMKALIINLVILRIESKKQLQMASIFILIMSEVIFCLHAWRIWQ